MSERFDDAVIGAGILGLAHAWHLARAGRRVVVFDRHPFAQGASIRNFGMVWPIGQPLGSLRALALRSRDLWVEIAGRAGFWHRPAGSLHVAYREDERQVLAEFAEFAAQAGGEVTMLDADDAAARSTIVRRAGLIGGLWSPHEVVVDPREATAALARWLAVEHGVRFEFGACVTECDPPIVVAGGRSWSTSQVWICAGDELRTLFADAFAALGLVRCKLQMMRTRPLPAGLGGPVSGGIGAMLAGGLTLCHYRSFADCPTLPALEARLSSELPMYARFGIHVLVSQHADGALTLGDSHEYGDAIEPFDKPLIDDLVLAYLSRFVDLPSVSIASRWHGIYVKHPVEPWCVLQPRPNVTAICGTGGAGMTLAFGLAERTVAATLGS